MMAEVTSSKNRFLSRGGYSPEQLVFGRSLTWPGELLQEREVLETPIHPGQGPGEQEMERASMIRRGARELAFQRDAGSRLSASVIPSWTVGVCLPTQPWGGGMAEGNTLERSWLGSSPNGAYCMGGHAQSPLEVQFRPSPKCGLGRDGS
eukprot:438562-Amphidinium_carterae.3